MQQIMVSIIIRKTVEIKRHFKSVTNLAKFKRYTAQNGTLILQNYIRVITKLPNSEQCYKGKVKTHKYINRQNQ